MSHGSTVSSAVARLAGVWALMASLAGAAQAQVYDFNRMLGGGGGGSAAGKQFVASAGAYICLGVSPGADANSVRFMVWSKIPQPASRIGVIVFDMGRHNSLFRSVAFVMGSPTVKGNVGPGRPHPFLVGMTPEFWVDVPNQGHHKPDGLAPGRMIALSASLGSGMTYANVINALQEGLNPQTAANGLRVGVIVYYTLGGPPPGVPTISDDAGFVTAGPSATCR